MGLGEAGRVRFDRVIRDLTDDEARRALVEKWGAVAPDVLPAWVAEMDFAIAPEIAAALHEAVDAGMVGYPRFGWGGELGQAYAGFAQRQFGQAVDPDSDLPGGRRDRRRAGGARRAQRAGADDHAACRRTRRSWRSPR